MAAGPVLPSANLGPVSFQLDPIGTLRKLAAEQGPLAEFEVAGQRVYLLSDPGLIQAAFASAQLHKRQGRPPATCLLGQGLMTSEGELNRRQRKALRPLFGHSAQAGWAAIVGQEAAALCSDWRDGQRLNSLAEMGRLSLAVACRCLLGRRLPEEPLILEALEECLNSPGSPSHLESIRARLDPLANALLRGARGPLIERLLALPISDELRRDEIITMLLGAHETTAATMAWCLRLLALHPLGPAHLEAGSPWPRAVVAESLRMYPAGWLVSRQADAPLQLGQYRVEGPCTVLMSPMVTHYLPKFWPEPEEFRPQRFLESTPVKGSFFPFGGGRRICIGESLAWLEAETALCLIASRWRLQPVDCGPVQLRPLAALRPACGLPARLERLP